MPVYFIGSRYRRKLLVLPFIPASELKKKYEVLGHFYSIAFPSGERVDCRSVLEIAGTGSTLDSATERTGLAEKRPDAVFIMMNPGSSRPLCEVDTLITPSSIKTLATQAETSLVPTRPDITQYQVMRLMHYCDWNHVRVLNLSDMRDPKSGNFTERYARLEKEEMGEVHSIFSRERSHERERRLGKDRKIPVICAWGVSPDLDPLIQRCLAGIRGCAVQGLLKENTSDKYFHPLPTLQRSKEAWVTRMVACCKK